MRVYHGTILEIEKPDIRFSKKNLDFGVGFYTTTFAGQAERWAARRAMRSGTKAIVNVYEVADLSEYCVKKFADADREWLEFVVNCRRGQDIYKDYDAIIGNVADDDVFKCVNLFMDGVWDEERTLREIRYYQKNDQIAFMNQRVIDEAISFKESYEVDPW